MRFLSHIIGIALIAGFTPFAAAQSLPADSANGDKSAKPIEITADKSLEWYQDQHLYVARENAKAVRNDLTVEADTLTAHEREKPPTAAGTPPPQPQPAQNPGDVGGGDIDKMTAEGNVRITTSRAHVFGDHAVYDTDKHVAFVTGDHLKYETDK